MTSRSGRSSAPRASAPSSTASADSSPRTAAASGASSSPRSPNLWSPDANVGFRIGAGYDRFAFDESSDDDNVDVDAFTIDGGYTVNRYLGVGVSATFGVDDGELDYDDDVDDLDFDEGGDLGEAVSASGDLGLDYLTTLYATASYPVRQNVDVSAKLGYAFVELDSTYESALDDDVDIVIADGADDGLAAGLAASWGLTDAIGLSLNYLHYEFDDVDADSLGLSFDYAFGR